jgi:hypothetical protein
MGMIIPMGTAPPQPDTVSAITAASTAPSIRTVQILLFPLIGHAFHLRVKTVVGNYHDQKNAIAVTVAADRFLHIGQFD